MSAKATIMTNVKTKLGRLPITLEITDGDIEACINDATREMKIGSISSVPENSDTELYVEIKTQWYVLSIARTSESTNFKYSTGSDGKTVDKTKISEAIDKIMGDLDMKFARWKGSGAHGVLNIPKRESTVLVGEE